MPFWRRFRRRVELDEDDFQAEIRAHLAIAAEEHRADGLEPDDAKYAALREFGNVTLTTEAARRVWTPAWFERLRDVGSDGVYAVRSLRKRPAFALTVIAVLAVGIGLNAAVFTMLKSMALSPIAGVSRSASLKVVVGQTAGGRDVRLSYPDFRHLRDNDDAFATLMGSAVTSLNLGRGKGARIAWAEIVSGNYFSALDVPAQLGRTILPTDETAPGRDPVVVLSDGLWRREFAADPGIVGRTIDVNNVPLTVVGVAHPDFHGTTVVYDVELYVPIMMGPQLGLTFGSTRQNPADVLTDPSATVFFPQGYLRPGVSVRQAAQRMDALFAPRLRERPATEGVQRLRMVPFWETPKGAPTYVLPSLIVMTSMGLLVLVIACANIAGLVLVRGVSRRGEIAVRLALGASRRRVMRLLLVESLVLAVPGALLGVLLAARTLPVFVGYAEWLAAPQRLFFNVQFDALVMTFTALVAVVCAMTFGFVPAAQASRLDLVTTINEDASPRGASRSRLRAGLVVAQVAVSLLLLVASGLATRSVEKARQANLGFETRQLAVVSMDVRQNRYDEVQGRAFYRRLLETVRADPAFESATLSTNVPAGMQETRLQRIAIDGHTPGKDDDNAFMSNIVATDYFRTLKIPLTAGRAFESADDARARPVAIVNATFAQRFFGSPSAAIGRRVRIGSGGWRTVVGVAADLKYTRVDEAPTPYLYVPFEQSYHPVMVLQTRGGGPIEPLVARTRAHVEALDPELPIISARAASERIRGALIFYELTATMLFAFGVAGMALAALGTYGLVSYTVQLRTHEIGIRIALGATRSSVIGELVRRGLRLGLLGAVLGVGGALAITRLFQGVLFGVSATDAVSFARALAVVLGGVLLATIVPAWRAARMNILHALRHQ